MNKNFKNLKSDSSKYHSQLSESIHSDINDEVLNDSDISFVLGELTKNSMPMCFTLLYFFFLIYNISKKYLIFYWIKSNFLLKFYTFRLFFKL